MDCCSALGLASPGTDCDLLSVCRAALHQLNLLRFRCLCKIGLSRNDSRYAFSLSNSYLELELTLFVRNFTLDTCMS